jgi:hypothetical protein
MALRNGDRISIENGDEYTCRLPPAAPKPAAAQPPQTISTNPARNISDSLLACGEDKKLTSWRHLQLAKLNW